MKFDVSNTWNGLAYCVKTKDSYVVINYKQLWFNKSEIIVFSSDDKGVVLDFKNPLFNAIYNRYDERYFYDAIKIYEYIEKKQRKTKIKKKVKNENKGIVSLSNITIENEEMIEKFSNEITKNEDNLILSGSLKNEKN